VVGAQQLHLDLLQEVAEAVAIQADQEQLVEQAAVVVEEELAKLN
jgi:hypothetical protein